MYLQNLQDRFKGKLRVFDDICIEQTQSELRLACIDIKVENQDIEQCIVNQVEALITTNQLIPLLVRLLRFIQQLKDAYYNEFEIQNHNIVLTKRSDGTGEEFDFTLIN